MNEFKFKYMPLLISFFSDSNAGPVPNSQVVGSIPSPDDHPDLDPIAVADEAEASTPKANLHEAKLPESVPP